MKNIVTYLADLSGWIHFTMITDELDFQHGYDQPDINNNKEYLNILREDMMTACLC
ncbi:MAG TPA: hypothetical protein VMT76_17970 [Puia sp.]|nr:hypothetical protein [Puia sp.]